jgi:histidine ammonia-lyase
MADSICINIGSKRSLTCEDIDSFVTFADSRVTLSEEGEFLHRINASRNLLLAKIEKGEDVYGATTGFGSSSSHRFDHSHSEDLQLNLLRYHRCGVGQSLSERVGLAALLIRTHCLAKGHSAVTKEMLQHMVSLLNHRLAAVIPAQGSVGASGDLTPLAYVGALLLGEGDAYHRGRSAPAGELFKFLKISPYVFKAREALALVNGTSVMTAIAAITIADVDKIAGYACQLTGLIVELLQGRASPFVPELQQVKPHPGQLLAAAKVLELINEPYQRLHEGAPKNRRFHHDGRIQDLYSIRCSPQVIGVLYDTLKWAKEWIEIEVNGISDNPVVSLETDEILNGGHFYGGHIAAASDALKTSLANIVNLMDRQFALLMSDRVAAFLSPNLVDHKSIGNGAFLHHGLKGVQISMSAVAAEIQKNSMPMGIFSRPTESGNQDVVSMGTIAARDLAGIVDQSKTAVAMLAMSIRQGYQVAESLGLDIKLTPAATAVLTKLKQSFIPLKEDRPLDFDIRRVRATLFEDDIL